MNELLQYLRGIDFAVPHIREAGYVLLFTYRVIEFAVSAKADRVIFTNAQFEWSKQGRSIDSFPITVPDSVDKFRKALHEVLETDQFVSRHIYIESETPEIIVCKIITSSQ